jgi:hypothetical protein
MVTSIQADARINFQVVGVRFKKLEVQKVQGPSKTRSELEPGRYGVVEKA